MRVHHIVSYLLAIKTLAMSLTIYLNQSKIRAIHLTLLDHQIKVHNWTLHERLFVAKVNVNAFWSAGPVLRLVYSRSRRQRVKLEWILPIELMEKA